MNIYIQDWSPLLNYNLIKTPFDISKQIEEDTENYNSGLKRGFNEVRCFY